MSTEDVAADHDVRIVDVNMSVWQWTTVILHVAIACFIVGAVLGLLGFLIVAILWTCGVAVSDCAAL